MLSPEEIHLNVMISQGSLSDIGQILTNQLQSLPSLDIENGKQYKKTMQEWKALKSVNSQFDALNLAEEELLVKQSHLNMQMEEMHKELIEKQEEQRSKLNCISQLNEEYDEHVEQFIKLLSTITEQLRQSAKFYNENFMKNENEQENKRLQELSMYVKKLEGDVETLLFKSNNLIVEIPENLLIFAYKEDMENELQKLNRYFEELQQTHDRLLNETGSKTIARQL